MTSSTTPPATPNTKEHSFSSTTPTRSLHSTVPRVRLNSKEYFLQQQYAATGSSSYAMTYPTSPSVSVETAPMTGGSTSGMTVSGSFTSLPNLISSSSSTPTNSSNTATTATVSDHAMPTSPSQAATAAAAPQHRFNSRDIPRSYAGQYQSGQSPDLLPMECMRSHHFLVSKVSFSVFALTYITLIAVLYGLAALIVLTTTSGEASAQLPLEPTLMDMVVWFLAIVSRSLCTIANAIHCLITILYVHWFQGSYLILDEQGELNGMTVWEQLEATSESSMYMRRSLWIMPTFLCYAACRFHDFNPVICTTNCIILCIVLVGKLPMMNGVRLFGINRTAGIDE